MVRAYGDSTNLFIKSDIETKYSLVQASKISFFIVHFRKVVGIALPMYIRFRIILTVLFNGALVNNEVT